VFRKIWVKGEEVKSPTDGKLMSPYERETIMLNTLSKKDSADPGTYLYGVTGPDGNALVDTAGNFYTTMPALGSPYRIVGDEAVKRMDERTLPFCKVEIRRWPVPWSRSTSVTAWSNRLLRTWMTW
jgi:hypothetical protein